MDPKFLQDVFATFAEYVSMEELRAVMEAATYEAVRASLSGATREEVMNIARTKAALLVTRVSEEMRQQLAEKIAYGIENQLGVDGTGRMLREGLGLDSNREKSLAKFRAEQEAAGKAGDALEKAVAREQQRLLNDRARTIAQNEIGTAFEEGALELGIKRGNTHKVSISVGDGRVAQICQQSEGQGPIPINEAFASGNQTPPHHIRCLVGNTPILAGGIVSAFRASYSGPVIEIHLADGRDITATPNHMFLTPLGFACAKSLREGDEILDCALFKRMTCTVNPNDDGKPATIEQVVTSLTKDFGMISVSMPPAPEDFHGDGAFANGNIDVVSAHGFLRDNVQSASNEGGRDNMLTSNRIGHTLLSGNSTLNNALFRLRDTTDGGVGIRRESGAFVGRHAAHANGVSGASATDTNPSFDQSCSNSATSNFDTLAKGEFGLSGQVSLDHVGVIEGSLSPMSTGDSVATEGNFNAPRGYIERLRNVIEAFSSEITTARILFASERHFSGHVYDLQTVSSLYIANGLVSSNCRCTGSMVRDTGKGELTQAEQRAAARAEKTRQAVEEANAASAAESETAA